MNKKAFTLAEMLITLAIIGVVSALVIPTVIKNYNDKKYNTARLKALKTFGEAGKMASINGEINGQPDARAFVENVLSKYLKIIKVCDNNKASECNFPEKIKPLNPDLVRFGYLSSDNYKTLSSAGTNLKTGNNWTSISDPNLSIYVRTADGFSAKIFYNPNCLRNSHENAIACMSGENECIYAIDAACMNIIYDMNGEKSPNHVGEDVGFITTFWSGLNTISVAPGLIPYEIAKEIYDEGNKTQDAAYQACSSRGTRKIQYTLPSIEELWSIILNAQFSQILCEYCISGSTYGNNFVASHTQGHRFKTSIRSTRMRVQCIRR